MSNKKVISLIILGTMLSSPMGVYADNKIDEKYNEIKSSEEFVREESRVRNSGNTTGELEGKEINEASVTRDTKKIEEASIKLGTTYTLAINKSNDLTEFHKKFTVPNDGLVSINLKRIDNDSINNQFVKLVSEDGKEIYLKGYEKGETIDYQIGLKAGNYKMILEAGFYVNSDKTYRTNFKVNFNKSDVYEKENNDSLEKANLIKINSEYKGILNEGSFLDEDFYRFTTSRKGDITFRLRGNKAKSLSSVRLYDAKGNLKESASSISEKEDYRGKYVEYTFKNMQEGQYNIAIKSLDYQVPYTILISQGVMDQGKFNDIAGHFAERDIVNFVNKGYTQGYSDGTFRPNKAITRAEFIKFTNKVFGYKNYGNVEKFSDVDSKDWYFHEVNAALNAGYITSKNATFRPNAPITREEVANIITSIKKCKDVDLDKLNQYIDKSKVSGWATSSVEGAIEKGYMGQGSKEFRPKDNITRGEAIVTLSRVERSK